VAAADKQILSPSAQKMAAEQGVAGAQIMPTTGKDGRVTKNDVLTFLKSYGTTTNSPAADFPSLNTQNGSVASSVQAVLPGVGEKRREERVPMTRLRKRIAERLKQAQDTAAILTTFNEVDMSAVMAIRSRTKDAFEKKHAVKLGFMSFFVQACVVALREIPAVNAAIEGDDLVYHSYCDIGVAVGTPQGLVVPIIRDVETLSFAQIEQTIAEYGAKARDGKLTMADMTGGTFTISNGGVYGSLMSTPILNPPQSAILGMHKIQERPVVVDGKIEIRPMMYLALSYDHRIIDGKEAVTFLVRVKECLEDPSRILLRM
jgi:2-oxoglutarate dehydrogenase E2 component (dihydrolipoamide succinyltransferase)